ncbi:SIS domain-containing protein [Bdellovibrionota bacterium FG-2]
MAAESLSLVEEALRSQRASWPGIAARILKSSMGALPKAGPKRIFIFGVGSSHFAARLSAVSVQRFLAVSEVWAGTSLAVQREVRPSREDWVIGISHRGGTLVTREAFAQAARSGAFPIWICGEGGQVAPEAKLVLETCAQEKAEPHTGALSGAICAITALLAGPRALEQWEALAKIPDPELEKLRATLTQAPQVILGEYEGEWLAKEAALKLMEMAGTPVRVFGSEEFFHGPKFSVASSDVFWHVCALGDLRAAEILARNPAFRSEVGGSGPLDYIDTLVELQWSALAVALNLGRNPDQPGASEK